MKQVLLVGCVALAAQGCFASSSDFEKLQASVVAGQQRSAAADTVERQQLASLSRSIAALGDSLRALNSRLVSSHSLTESQIAGLKQDIAQLQDLTGQSEARLKEIRATIEERAPTISNDTAAQTGPGPAQLLQLGRDQMLKRSYSSGRDALNDLLRRFPSSDLAPDAIYEIAGSYRAENNLRAADSSYAELAFRFPNSPRIPAVLYKRGLILQSLGQQAEARRLFEDVRRRFPRSPEAALAQERLGGAR